MTIQSALVLHLVLQSGIDALLLATLLDGQDRGRTTQLQANNDLKLNVTQTELACRLKHLMSSTQWATKLRHTKGHMRRLSHTQGTCAVVSNSGVLLDHTHGADIDKADYVIRFNDAPMKGFEQIVGSKEHMRLVNLQFAGKVLDGTLNMSERGIYIVTLHQPSNTTWIEDYLAASKIYPHAHIFKDSSVLQNSFDEMLKEVYDETMFRGFCDVPTSGAIGMLLALGLCGEVKAYGMAKTNASHSAPFHYYDSDRTNPGQNADINNYHQTANAEKELWRLLAANGEDDVESSEVAIIPGLSKVHCTSGNKDN